MRVCCIQENVKSVSVRAPQRVLRIVPLENVVHTCLLHCGGTRRNDAGVSVLASWGFCVHSGSRAWGRHGERDTFETFRCFVRLPTSVSGFEVSAAMARFDKLLWKATRAPRSPRCSGYAGIYRFWM